MGSRTSHAVSVVIPLHDGAAHIAETLGSVQAQTAPVHEVLVVDDGSHDDGAEIARRHAVGPVVIAQSNLGVAMARNRGLSAATGDWIAFFDQDDLWHPEHLEQALTWLDDHPDEQLVFLGETAFQTDDDAESLKELDASASAFAQVSVPAVDTRAHLVRHVHGSGSDAVRRHDLRGVLAESISTTTSFVARTDLIRLAGGFAPHARALDEYVLYATLAHVRPIPHLDRPTVFYRVHAGATSRTTRLGIPFLATAVGLRFGAGLIDVDEAMRGGLAGGLHAHLLDGLLRSERYADRRFRAVVDSLARLLWPPDGMPRSRRRALLARRAPWLASAVRRLRGR